MHLAGRPQDPLPSIYMYVYLLLSHEDNSVGHFSQNFKYSFFARDLPGDPCSCKEMLKMLLVCFCLHNACPWVFVLIIRQLVCEVGSATAINIPHTNHPLFEYSPMGGRKMPAGRWNAR